MRHLCVLDCWSRFNHWTMEDRGAMMMHGWLRELTLCVLKPQTYSLLYMLRNINLQYMFLSKWKWIQIHSDNILLYMYMYIYVTESIFNWFNIQIIYWKWALLPPVFEPSTLSQLSHYKTGAQIGVLQWMDEVAKCVATINAFFW